MKQLWLVGLVLWMVVLCGAWRKSDVEAYFDILDEDNDGRIGWKEVMEWDTRFAGVKKEHKVKEEKMEEVMGRLDQDDSGDLSKNEVEWVFSRRAVLDEDIPIEEVHLMVTDKVSEMVIMWVTRTDVESPSTVVQYGLESGKLTKTVMGSKHTYHAGWIEKWQGWIHEVVLMDLQPDTKYFYRCGSPETGYSKELHFKTRKAPSKAVQMEKTVFAVFGDMGTYIPMGWAVTDQLVDDNKKEQFDMVMHVGDVCYAGTGSTDAIQVIWDIWENQVQPLAAYVPYMFAVGNHEHYYNFTAYRNRFDLPGEQSGGNGNFWWSMDFQGVHWTQMSTEHPYAVGSPQYQWLEEDLAKADANRDIVPWIFLTGHRPMYCSDQDEWSAHRTGSYLQRTIEPLLHKYKVDLYMCGHMHMYERIYPVWNGTVTNTGNVYRNPTGVAQVVQGTGGVFTDFEYIDPKPAWSAYRTDDWGYGKLTVYNATTLQYQFLREYDDAEVDGFWLIKS